MINRIHEREFLVHRRQASFRKFLASNRVVFISGGLGCVLILLVGLAPLGASAEESEIHAEPEPSPESIATAMEILDARYQIELPNRVSEVPETASVSGSGTVLPNIIVKIIMVLGAIIILVTIFNLFFGGARHHANPDDEALDAQGEVDFTKLKLADPDRLAASGRFAEAIHALLLRALVLISRRLDSSWPRSLTSREILRHGKLPGPAQSHLGQLIQRVEVHHFGGLEPVAADYSRCQEIYEKLRADLNGGAR
jgi:hypothetical protein